MYEYDLIVVGAGAAGLTATYTALGFGKKVLLIESNRPGGECTWSGCIPSKALIHQAALVYQSDSQRTGSSGHSHMPDTSATMANVRAVIEAVYQEETPEKIRAAGADYVEGDAHFIDQNTVHVNARPYTARRFVIATGSSPQIPPVSGIRDVEFLTNNNFFEQQSLPASLIILGAGPIGIEMAQATNRLGVNVTVVDMLPEILFREEPSLASRLRNHLESEGVHFKLGLNVSSISPDDTGVEMLLTGNGRQITLHADKLLVATGRKPNFAHLGLHHIGFPSADHIHVNNKLQTCLPHIYACGDVIGPFQFSHMANYQAKIATMNALLPFKRKVDYGQALWTTYTDPEFSRLGLTEQEAREKYGNRVRVYDYDFSQLDRVKTHPGEFGCIKLICDRRSRILGAHILGPRAGELITELQLLKQMGKPITRLQSIVHPYPGYADALRQLAQQIYLDDLKKSPFIRLLTQLQSRMK